MTYRLGWDFPALVTFYDLRIPDAAALDRAVIRFAETGEGDLEHEPPYYRLRTGTHDALLVIDHAARMVTVLRILRAR
jgi:hypothetical protein